MTLKKAVKNIVIDFSPRSCIVDLGQVIINIINVTKQGNVGYNRSLEWQDITGSGYQGRHPEWGYWREGQGQWDLETQDGKKKKKQKGYR